MIEQLKTLRRKIESARIELQRLCQEEENLRTDEGAIALYEEPTAPADPVNALAELDSVQNHFGDTDDKVATQLYWALRLAKDRFIAHGLDLPKTFEVINEALAAAEQQRAQQGEDHAA